MEPKQKMVKNQAYERTKARLSCSAINMNKKKMDSKLHAAEDNNHADVQQAISCGSVSRSFT